MAIVTKSKTRLVCIRMSFSTENPEAIMQAMIYEKNKPPVWQFLNPETRKAMGDDLKAYFNAGRIGNIWFVGERQHGGWNW